MGEGGGSGPGEGQWWPVVGPEGGGCWPWDRGTAGDGRESKARQAAMTSGPDDCHVTMQAAIAVVLAKRWPYVVLRWQ